MDDRPTLHVIAGPNGAGKTTLYRHRLARRLPNVEFVNADELARQHFGHAAHTLKESQMGQRLAEGRRRALIAERKSLITESTFSHPSKLDLVRDAQAAGYRVAVYHVNVRSAQVSVKRVAFRVDEGGHPVPEDKIRERYERNKPLIRQAVKLADRAYVFDNSVMGKAHTLAIELRRGQAVRVSRSVPPWARDLYAPELQHYSAARQNRPAASFAEAEKITRTQLHEEARTFIARAGGRYVGTVIGETDLHTLQKIGKKSVVAHFTARLDKKLAVGDHASVTYDRAGTAHVQRESDRGSGVAEPTGAEYSHSKTKPGQDNEASATYAQAALGWLKDPASAAKQWPALAKSMKVAQDMVLKAEQALRDGGMLAASVDFRVQALRQRLASDLADGQPIKARTQEKAIER